MYRFYFAGIPVAFVAVVIVVLNLWPGTWRVRLDVADSEWQWYGWPATYLAYKSIEPVVHLEATRASQFSASALAANASFSAALCGITWFVASVIHDRRLTLWTTVLGTLFLTLLAASYGQAAETSIDPMFSTTDAYGEPRTIYPSGP